ncbi:MAG: hypothetical protein LIO79_05040 [Rikenellaceae bacterium]|nr:hypothetical protein [Rikenellaceae bacterium]
MDYLIVAGILCVYWILHESGHILSAVMLGLKIEKIGIGFYPIPHLYVAVDKVRNKFQEYIFLFAGFFITCCIILVLFFGKYLTYKMVYVATAIQIMIETNPVYSDFTIALNAERFTLKWNLYFTVWGFLSFILFNPNMVYGWIEFL